MRVYEGRFAAGLNNHLNTKIGLPCYFNKTSEVSLFVPEHVFSYQLSGKLTMTDSDARVHIFNEGNFRFIRRNNLVKYINEPAPGGEFKSVSIYLDQDSVRNFGVQHTMEQIPSWKTDTVIKLKPHALYKSFMESLQPYRLDDILISSELQQLKVMRRY